MHPMLLKVELDRLERITDSFAADRSAGDVEQSITVVLKTLLAAAYTPSSTTILCEFADSCRPILERIKVDAS